MSKFNELKDNEFYLGLCKLDHEQKVIIKKNPHCAEFFCTLNNILDCSNCLHYLEKKRNVRIQNQKQKNQKKINSKNATYCHTHCRNGLIYDFIAEKWDSYKNGEISKADKFKIIKNFYQSELIYKYDQISQKLDFEPTMPKPKSVVHWGQLKMFLITLIFMVRYVDPKEKEVHIIYPGSARGDNVLILCDMFPNTIWYLIDPNPFHKDLKNHKQVKEINNGFFTDETAEKYAKQFANRKHPLLLLSDIRLSTDDKAIIENQESNVKWHKIIKPDFSYFKFRCPYGGDKDYQYYDGKIFIQPYARVSSSEARILFETNIVPKTYNIHEYVGKFVYFNRILRPSYYKKRIIPKDHYFDNCYDCTYFSYLIQNYLNKFNNVNPFKTNDLLTIMKAIVNIITKLTIDRIAYQNTYIRRNILD